MNSVDLFLILVFFFSVAAGYMKGFVHGSVDLLLLAGSLLFAFATYPHLALVFQKYIPAIGVWTLPLAFITAFVLARLLLAILSGFVFRSVAQDIRQKTVNKALGIFPGAVNGILNAAIAGALLLALPLFDGLTANTRESKIVAALTPPMEWAEEKFAPVFDKAVNHSMNKLTVAPGTTKRIELPFSVTNARVREDLETSMLDLVNAERKKAGLPTLEPDPEMQVIARAHSRDMFVRGYFSHHSPEGESLGERARKEGIRYLTAGENLALAQTLRLAHRGLMNSPGHRANILHKGFGRVGIGILDGGRHGIMVTQNFRN